MLKKFIITFTCLFMPLFPAFAQDETDAVRAFFDQFVLELNSYKKNVTDNFTPDAQIIRVVIKPDGTRKSVTMSRGRYHTELLKGSVGAKLVGYKNNFSNIQIVQEGDQYRLTAVRIPNKGGGGLDSYYIIIKTPNGYKIKTESWDTKQQSFLKG